MSDEHERLVTTERERLEALVSERTKDVEQSREMFRLMAESTNAIPFTLDLERGRFPYIGATAVVESGLCEPGLSESEWRLPGALDRVFPRGSHAELRGCFDACVNGPFDFVTAQPRRGNLRAEVRWTGTCDAGTGEKYLRGLMLDITEFRRLSREKADSQKLESVGRLAAGVAHEINTPVQFVADNVQFVRTSIVEIENVVRAYRALRTSVEASGDSAAAAQRAAEAEAKADLDYLLVNLPLAVASAIEGLDRIATIVRSMKEISHPDQAEKSHADLNQAVKSTLVIAHNEYKYVAELDSLFGDLPPVPCYLGEINQVLLNLLVNASHAMAEAATDGAPLGKLTVRTRRAGNLVEISIGDTGGGIPKSVRDKIFEPFFTTKPVGKGTGQGLAIARSVIVNKHGGTLHFETEIGKGTTFFIRLPIDDAAAAAQVAA
jgi:signal transduction histidine kinase